MELHTIPKHHRPLSSIRAGGIFQWQTQSQLEVMMTCTLQINQH